MSAKPLLFEGPDPQKLLLQAWSQLGTDVRISEPVRVRSGGFLGFFAKLHYRIEVEPAPAATAPAAAPLVAPGARAERREVEQPSPAGALEQLVSETEDVFEATPAPRRSFDQVLEGVASSLGESPESLTLSGIADPAPLLPAPTPRPARRPSPEQVSPTTLELAAASGPPPTELSPPARSAFAPRPGPELAARAEPGTSVAQLAALGFPASLLARLGDPAGRSSAEAAFALAPIARPLPTVAGALIAVLGELKDALAVVEGLQAELRLDDATLAVATAGSRRLPLPAHQVVRDTTRAAALSPGWRRDSVALVAVEAGTAACSPAWSREMLRALRPSAVWSLARATSKSEDIAHFCRAVGGVDALLLSELAATVSPAAVLAIGIPVARLDGVAASPAAWLAATGHLLASEQGVPRS